MADALLPIRVKPRASRDAIRGRRSRDKLVRVEGMPLAEVSPRLLGLGAHP